MLAEVPVHVRRDLDTLMPEPVWLKEKVIVRNLAFAVGQAALLVLFTPTSGPAAQAQFGTEKEAKAMLEKAVAALKENKVKALETFNKGEGGFKDRDLYVFCANTADLPGFLGWQGGR